MLFGLSFGSNKKTTTSNTAVAKDESTSQQQTGTQNQQQTSSSTQTGTSNTSGFTSGQTATSGTTAQQTTGQQRTTQTTQSLSDAILGALEASTQNALTAGGTRVGPTAGDLNFDLDTFVNQGMTAARAASQGALEQSSNGLIDNIGGTASGNSMAALLLNRLQGDNAAALAGVNAQLTAQGNQILRENIGAGLAEQAQSQSWAANLLNQLKGAATATTGAATTSESTTGQQQNIGQQQQSQQQAQQTSQQTDTTSALISIINQLMQGNTRMTGTESSVGTEKKSGGGFSLSI